HLKAGWQVDAGSIPESLPPNRREESKVEESEDNFRCQSSTSAVSCLLFWMPDLTALRFPGILLSPSCCGNVGITNVHVMCPTL
ncbi:hypothetical protein STEG23_004378, partial [Scotinomys teguina]